MAKKVYKNKLEQEKAERKEARRKQMQGKVRTQEPSRMEKIYAQMGQMSEQEMQNRLNEIAKRKDVITRETLGRNGKDGQEKRIDELKAEYEKLDREEKRLKAYPEVKDQIAKIMVYRDRFAKRKEMNLKAAEEELAKATNAELRAKQIDDELKDLEKYSEEFSKKTTITEEDRRENIENAKKWNNLLKEKGKLDGISEKTSELKAKVDMYRSGRSKEDARINKCNMAWKLLLSGKSWDEISLIAAEEVQKRQASKKEKTEEIKNVILNGNDEQGKAPENGGEFDLKLEDDKKEETKSDFDEKHPVLSKIPGLSTAMKKREEAKANKEEQKGESLPAKVEKFEDKHPRLAKIPFLGKRLAERSNKKSEQKQQDNTTDKAPQTDKKKTERDMFIEYLRESVGDGHTEQGKYATKVQEKTGPQVNKDADKDEMTH